MIYDIRDCAFPGETRGCSRQASEIPIVFDNGSWQARAGYASDRSPTLVFDNLYSKHKARKSARQHVLVGNDTLIDPMVRAAARSPFDGNIVTNWEAMENILDYTFLKLGLGDSSSVNPIVMTEALSNPNYNRKRKGSTSLLMTDVTVMSELLFECYRAPSVVYGIDSLFSYYQNKGMNGVVISGGHTSTSIVSVIAGSVQSATAKRLSLGGATLCDYALKLAQLKYPSFPTKVTPSQASLLVKDHCFLATNFSSALESASRLDFGEIDRVIQFPYTDIMPTEKTEDELKVISARKKEAGRRLQEQAAAKRAEREEKDISYYTQLREKSRTESKKDFQRTLESEDLDDEIALASKIKKLEQSVRKAKSRELGVLDEAPSEAPDFSLLDIPDGTLDELQLKAKRGQRLLKASHDARLRAKMEREADKLRRAMELDEDERKRIEDPQTWLLEKHLLREQIQERIKNRRRLKSELADRKSLASQERMKHIAGLAASSEGKRKRKGDDDNFGANDEDWLVYRDIGNASDPEEEDDSVNLKQLEETLLVHDPSFTASETMDARMDPSKSLLRAFVKGPYDQDEGESSAADHQLHLNIERFRVPEIVFQPSLIGLDQSGIVEIVRDMLSRVDLQHRPLLTCDIFLTGGTNLLPGFKDRLYSDLRASLPAEHATSVRIAQDPLLDAWRGAAKWCTEGSAYRNSFVTRAEYDEMGAEYMKEHGLGNAVL